MKRVLLSTMLLVLWPGLLLSAENQRRPMTVNDLLGFKRVSDPQISPDGKLVAYVVAVASLSDNKLTSSIWLSSTNGTGSPRQLTYASGKRDRHPRWSPDGGKLLFESNRSGNTQLWIINLDGGEATQLTRISTEASNGIWSPDGKQVAFVSAVYPEFSAMPFRESDTLNKKRSDGIEKDPVKARVFTRLFFRHWDSYVEDRRQHLFVMALTGGEPRDVTPGDRDAYPTSSTFESGENFTFSPDGSHLIFTAVPSVDEAWSTNYDLCRVPAAGGSKEWEPLTRANSAADNGPVFSPDGTTLAYRAQQKAGYEADRWQLMAVEVSPDGRFRSQPRSLTPKLDSSVDSLAWSGDSGAIFFVAEERGATPVFRVPRNGPSVQKVSAGHTHSSLTLSRTGGVLACSVSALHQPPEVFIDRLHGRLLEEANGSGSTIPMPTMVSGANKAALAALELRQPESVTVKGAGGTPMQMWLLKPPGFDPARRWPLVYLVHGGPQGAWEDGWSFRWNAQVWAAQGYVVAMPNPRGSTGFGQKYIDEITGDWGGKCYEDLMKGVDYLERLPYIDSTRMAAAGASFGGYMMNWFAVNTGRFKTLITHCSVWNFDSMYGTTDEIWFDEYEHGGPPWGKNRHSYEKHSPHRFAGNLGKFKTPMLIIHNDLDFRCPIGQGHELFTSLQRQGVRSRFVNFPDEGHWVSKPANSRRWHEEVFAWLKKHVEPGGK